MPTDGGNAPRALWWHKSYGPWAYTPAYIIHDWLYYSHCSDKAASFDQDQNQNHITYTKDEAD